MSRVIKLLRTVGKNKKYYSWSVQPDIFKKYSAKCTELDKRILEEQLDNLVMVLSIAREKFKNPMIKNKKVSVSTEINGIKVHLSGDSL